MHLQLKPALRRVWREPGTLQIGLSERRGTILRGLTGEDVHLLTALGRGVDPAPPDGRRAELVRLLSEAGVLVRRDSGTAGGTPLAARHRPDAAVWSVVHPGGRDGADLVAARRRRHVSVLGAGRLGTVLAATLAAAGVGHVTVDDPRRVTPADLVPAGAGHRDLGRPRADVARDAVRRAGGTPDGPDRQGTGAGTSRSPDLVVLVEHGAADAARTDPLVNRDVPHLSVVVRDDDVVVGPLVRPGDGPCLRCLDLHRGDRDPAWPSVLAQVLRPPRGAPEPEEVCVATTAAGLAALQALAHLDGLVAPAAAGATLEVELPDGLTARREWPAHPRCGCQWRPEQDLAPAGVTMGR